ncbi:PREDICTED: cholecystokinin receptor type A-like [Thamnophis sirtalis]|uniref:Cholecystokinin receptor type A-like n=1 Tax=Thamnophis sirtalis TaxID=35019 RepID=A0A6I9Z0J1_9SAUR|nr:PREDICTED: cholecystokinin receptor type A-like [Thamnophis sirtalis]
MVGKIGGGKKRKASDSSRGKYDDGDGCYLKKKKKKHQHQHQQQTPLRQPSALSSSSNSQRVERPRSSSSSVSLMAKKLVIRMLIVIVILFFICWTPIFSVNTWRAFDPTSAQLLLSGAPISFIHLLSYTSACVNPIVYCFMNKRFRLGFLATFTCCAKARLPAVRAEMGEDEEGKTTRASLSSQQHHARSSRSDQENPPSTPKNNALTVGIDAPRTSVHTYRESSTYDHNRAQHFRC